MLLFSCKQEERQYTPGERATVEWNSKNGSDFDKAELLERIIHDTSELERKLITHGLQNVSDLNPYILVDLKYASTDNFLEQNVYGSINRCYLQPDVAGKLAHAQAYLDSIRPGYRLLVYDCVRPRSVQQQMWDILEMPDSAKIKFVSNPKYGSLHNFGAAVDLTIVDHKGDILDMGTPFDYIGELAYPTKEQELLNSGELSQEIIDNRKLLRKVMYRAGFFNIQTEWWHFNSCYRKEAWQKYKIVE